MSEEQRRRGFSGFSSRPELEQKRAQKAAAEAEAEAQAKAEAAETGESKPKGS